MTIFHHDLCFWLVLQEHWISRTIQNQIKRFICKMLWNSSKSMELNIHVDCGLLDNLCMLGTWLQLSSASCFKLFPEFQSIFNGRRQTQRLLFRRSFKIRFTFWSRFSFFISRNFHVCLLAYFTHCFIWMDFKCFNAFNYALWWILAKLGWRSKSKEMG